MIEAAILNIQRLWRALRDVVATKSLFKQKISRWIFYLFSLLRLRYHEHHKERPRPPPPTSCPPTENMCTSASNNGDSFSMSICPKDSHYEHDVISLSDATIAFSRHPYFSSGETTPHRRNITDAFSVPASVIPMYPLDTTSRSAIPRSQSLQQSPPILSSNTPNLEVSAYPGALSPTHSVAHPLLPTEGPAGEPKKLAATLGEHSKRFTPLIPMHHARYERPWNVRMPKTPSVEINVEPLQTRFSQTAPDGWSSYLHPEGVLYFCNPEKRIYTDANLYDEDILAFIYECICELCHFLNINSIVISPSADLVLDIVDKQVYYYFADHRSRTVFYLDNLTTSDFYSWHAVQGASSMGHFAHLIEAEYWWHIYLFPTSITIEETIVNEFFDAVVYQIGGTSNTMTSAYSTSTYNLEDLLNFLNIANSLKENVGTLRGGSICMLSRFMWGIARGRFLHWHGQPSARLSRDASAHGPIIRMRPKLMKIATILLFGAPNSHLYEMERIRVDQLRYENLWKDMYNKLSNEWQLYILFSTVLLNVNVAFLAIQTIDQTDHPYRSPGQISSYLSLISSMGSIILSLLLYRIIQTEARKKAQEAWEFLTEHAHPKYGLELLAIAYSLPFGLLVWSVIAFLVAIAWMCFDNANESTRILTGLASVVVAALVGFCVWMGWESEWKPLEEAQAQDDASAASVRNGMFLNLKRFKFSLPHLRVPRRSTDQSAATV